MNNVSPGYLVLDSATLTNGTARYAGRNASAVGEIELIQESIRQSLVASDGSRRAGLKPERVDSLVRVKVDLSSVRLDERGRGDSGHRELHLRLHRRVHAVHDDHAVRAERDAQRARGEDDARGRGGHGEREARHPARREDPRRRRRRPHAADRLVRERRRVHRVRRRHGEGDGTARDAEVHVPDGVGAAVPLVDALLRARLRPLLVDVRRGRGDGGEPGGSAAGGAAGGACCWSRA